MKTKILIPAAGYGVRVGNPESKEMLRRPDGVRFIDHALRLSREAQAEPHVIVRSGKNNLVQHLQNLKISHQLVGQTKDWPQTLLLSIEHWEDFNIVILPDTDFEPIKILQDLKTGMQNGYDLVAARFAVSSFSQFATWGVMGSDGVNWYGCEKPRDQYQIPKGLDIAAIKAWGLFGFKKDKGVEILQAMLKSTLTHQWQRLSLEHQFYDLEIFQDLTR